ncbi:MULTISPECIES: TetR/AcrR family transcriptional regulator [unclassified Streptomyces]|uniref:TetR/AcrR family transcriptional regulator n=1 Tax=unclassified Streptomyces TaxID=2593676 RepID=UPI00278C1E63|nr:MULTISPECIES: TetR/AcrR family transcriptional regulator [unclassified Streptomyces]
MQLRAEQTRSALIDVAASHFYARGTRSTGLVEISREAGVSKGALYFHFSSKEELVATILREAREHAHALVRRYLGESAPHPGDLGRFTAAFARELRQNVVLRAGLRLESDGEGEPPTLRQEWTAYLRRHFSRGKGGEGELAELISVVTIGLAELGRDDCTWWAEDTVCGIWNLMLAGPAELQDRLGGMPLEDRLTLAPGDIDPA